MTELAITKMHGLGNDFVVIKGPMTLPTETIAQLCDRHRGVGADGLLIISPQADGVRMQYWNADGSTAEMCGNGLRCAARFAVENNLVKAGTFAVETAVGKLKVTWDGVDADAIEGQVGKVMADTKAVTIGDVTFYTATVGNPHAITFVDDTATAPVTTLGPEVEVDKFFPNQTNVEFAQVVDQANIRLRIWERGVGETLACGTGMVSTAVVSHALGKTDLPVTVTVPGGSAKVWIDEAGFACLRGPAVNVFSGTINI